MEELLQLIKTKIAILIAAFTLSGCLQIFTTVNVNPDGSGEVEETVLLGKNLLELLQSISVMFQDSTKVMSAEEIFTKEDILKSWEKMGNGTQLKVFENVKEKDLTGYRAVFSFKDISQIKIDQNPDNKMPSFGEENESESQNGGIGFEFHRDEKSHLKILLPEIKSEEKFNTQTVAEDTSVLDQREIDEFVEMFNQLKVSVRIKVNGEIISTNAHHIDGNTITVINFDIKQVFSNPDLIKLFREKKPSNISDMEKFADLIPGFQFEFNNITDVTFK